MSLELDIGPLTWVKGEIDLALERAGDALTQLAAVPDDTVPLKQARNHLHQAHGALAIVGIEGITRFSETLEQLLGAIQEQGVAFTPEVAAAAQNGLVAIRHYLDDLLAGKSDQPLRLFPAYRDLIVTRGGGEPSPAELFFPDLTQRPPRREREPEPLAPEAVATRLKAARLGYQRGLLKWLKNDAQGLKEMRNSLAVIEMTQALPGERAFWWVALAFIDAVAAGAVAVDAAVRKLAGRIDAQIARLAEGVTDQPEATLRELLYWVATAGPSGEHLECVRAAYRLADLVPAGPAPAAAEAKRPMLKAARERLGVAMEEWGRYCAGTDAALGPFAACIKSLVEQADGLDWLDLGRVATALDECVAAIEAGTLARGETAALEVATGLLFVESALDRYGATGEDFGAHATGVATRLTALSRNEALVAHDIPQLDDMARRAQDRLLLRTVAKEILGSLAVVEQALDAFFRNPERRDDLAGLAKPLHQIEGALRVLGQERAAAVVREAAAQVAAFAEPGYAARQPDFEAVAQRLSALGFFVEQLQSGKADIDAILGIAPPAMPAAAAEPVAPPPAPAVPEPAPAADAATASPSTELPPFVAAVPPAEPELDAEMLGIFLEEANEVLATIAGLLPRVRAQAGDRDALTGLRRAFHTLKGSGRMVGLTDLGEAAWAVEQVMNRWLQFEREATAGLLDMLGAAHALFADWVAQLEAGGGAYRNADDLAMLCEMLKEESAAPAAAPVPVAPTTPVAPPPEAPAAPTLQLVYSAPAPVAESESPEPLRPPEGVRVGDELVVAPALYDLYLAEARGHVATLQGELGQTVVPRFETVRAAHTLGSISATTGIAPVRFLAHALEAALDRLVAAGVPPDENQRMLLARVAGALDGMVGAVAERRLPAAEEGLTAELVALRPQAAAVSAAPAPSAPPAQVLLEPELAAPAEPTAAAVPPAPGVAAPAAEALEVERRRERLRDEIDPQLLPIFLEEAQALMPEIDAALRAWRSAPEDRTQADALKRLLHTFKGSARMAGAMGVGELTHSMESRIEQAAAVHAATPEFLDALQTSWDRADRLVVELRGEGSGASAGSGMSAAGTSVMPPVAGEPSAPVAHAAPAAPTAESEAPGRAQLRVRAEIVDRLVNEAGEMAIARSRIEGEMRALKASLLDLTENVIRLRAQLREIEIQAETQIQSHQESADHGFDPLEFDRFTRFQELTRMMAESVNDVGTVQHTLLRNIDHANAALTAQARLNRDLSQSLMAVRMVPFASIADRLHRVVRLTAKELGRRANLDIRGGQTEIDRSVLERMTGPLEHLLRNAVAHGIEPPAVRAAAGKAETGEIAIELVQEGNEILIALADDGAGLDLAGIRARAAASGLLGGADLDDERALTQLIFRPGFSTAGAVTEVAGRGVGMDVVRAETTGLGGRIEVASGAGRGTTFRIWLPLTLAVAQAVMVRASGRIYAIPSTMVEQASELKPAAAEQLRADGGVDWLGNRYPWHYLPCLLGDAGARPQPARRHWVLLLKGGARRIAVEVDGLVGNQEIVVKSIGPQLARIVGLAGATVLGDGEVALILNPVALAGRAPATAADAAPAPTATAPATKTVLIVDDSLTVRKITGRLLARSGYHVMTAKDGIDALDQMADLLPDIVLADIEMPNMDGFELARSIRADGRLKHLPIVMITSRTADKHRSYAAEIGVEHYLGKPYDEDELLRLIAGLTAKPA